MSDTVSLPPSVINQLQDQAAQLGLSANELAEKLINQGLVQLEFTKQLWQLEPKSVPSGSTENHSVEGAETVSTSLSTLISEIKSRPRSQGSFHPATGTLDEALAAFTDDSSNSPALTLEEWNETWWPIREEMRKNDRMRHERFNFHDDKLP